MFLSYKFAFKYLFFHLENLSDILLKFITHKKWYKIDVLKLIKDGKSDLEI